MSAEYGRFNIICGRRGGVLHREGQWGSRGWTPKES